MKVAIVHDLLLEYGGSERVLDALLKIFPDADIYTFYYNKSEAFLSKYSTNLVGTSFLSNIPFLYLLGGLFSITKLFSWIYYLFLDLRKYQVVITSSHSYNSKLVRQITGLHIGYFHTVPRYLYGDFHELEWINRFPISILFYPIKLSLRFIDKWGAQQPDLIFANSVRTKTNIQKIYGRKSVLLYPPILTKHSTPKSKRYFVTQSRLVRQKGLELIIRVCTKHQLPLIVVGDGYYRSKLERIAGKSIIFLGAIPDDQLDAVYEHAFALLYAAHADDFGLVPVEALYRGIPIVGYYTGGMKEILNDTKNGIAFYTYSERGLLKAINRLLNSKISLKECRDSVQKFSYSYFKRTFLESIKNYEY